MKTIAISGSSGFVGQYLIKYLQNNNYKVIAIKRDDFFDINQLINKINKTDIVINLNGANIIKRWTPSYKKVLYSSRIDTTKALVNAISQSSMPPKTFISTSAVGIYKNDKIYDESSTHFENNFLSNLCQDWEKEANKAKNFDIRTLVFRFGIVLGKDGGAFAKMLPPFKMGLGGIIGDGTQPFSFIHIEDLARAYKYVIENQQLDGVFNLTAQIPTTNLEFTKTLGKKLHRPTLFPIPKFILKFIFSEGSQTLTDGQSVIPQHLLNSGFEFKYKNIDKCIEGLID